MIVSQLSRRTPTLRFSGLQMSNNDRSTSNESESHLSQRFIMAVVTLFFSQLVGEKSVILAKLFYFYFHGPDALELWKVMQVSLVLLMVFTSLAILIIVRLVEANSERVEQVLLFVALAFITAGFAIIDQYLPSMDRDKSLRLWETLYYFGWPMMLWFVIPYFLLDGSRRERVHKIVTFISISFVGLVICGGVGGILLLLAPPILEYTKLIEGAVGVLDDPIKFWQASPPTINSICALFVVVAFAPKWWRNLKLRVSWTAWILILTGFAFIYAGIFGIFYAEHSHFVDPDPIELQIQLFSKFGSFSLIITVVFLLSLWLVRHQSNSSAIIGFPVGNCFWMYLSIGLGLGFPLVQLFGFLPYGPLVEAEAIHVVVVLVSHALNGICLGFSLRSLKFVIRYVIRCER